ncbi:RNA pyrophosphohydrolase [Anianabacter salinae]|uniref:RNA pyrophosphohydrolase n=1 Tax=Anianabacter salinae TaxID=2851023 RepID=UPI00225DDA44|nr:RNA pyrophosphohydrolase [Anianabacter salinae]MBV0913381.1 RNA pyrophosphohydrolase [Anianabacter salinae]
MTPRETLPYRPCAGVVLVNAQGLVFAGQRLDSEVPAWQMPQGGIDKGETPREAALRELWEETGVRPELVRIEAETSDWVTYDLPDHLLGKVWKGRFRGQKQMWVLMRFHGTDADIDIASGHPEFSEWRWLTASEIIDAIVPFKRAVYAEVFRQFEGHLA